VIFSVNILFGVSAGERDMGNDGAASDGGDKTKAPHDANMVSPQAIDELPDELQQKLQAKLDADVQAFLESCTKDRRDKVTQFQDSTYGDDTAATTTTGTKVNPTNKPRYDEDPYPTHANYAAMMDDHRKVIDNNLFAAINTIMARFDKLEAKTTNDNASVVDSSFKQPEFGLPLHFYENQNVYAAANKGKSASSALEAYRAGLACSGPYNNMVIYNQNMA
jgi:hypothetical protein